MGRRSRLLIVVLATIAALAVVLPGVAEASISVAVPAKSICLGRRMIVGVRHKRPAKRTYTINIVDPMGRKVWSRTGSASSKWRRWRFRPGRLGTFRTVYRLPGGKRRAFKTKVMACTKNAVIIDDDYQAGQLSLSNAAPGATDSGCVRVTYAGKAKPKVRLYGTTTGTGLDAFLQLTVVRGKLPGSTATCSKFRADALDYIGVGPGVIFQDTLDQFPDSYITGLVDPGAGGLPEVWTNKEYHAYRITVTMVDDNAAQGLTAGQTFKWDARAP
jgi:hypothetical protein